MASKFGFAGGIPERRVRPIWEAIESRQYKAALKQAAALLAKHPNSPYALALKALILERTGKADEALSVCLNAKDLLYTDDVNHLDDFTLSTLQIVFQRLDHLDLATSCYEHACAKFPNNREFLMGLFNCHVREYSYIKQQQIAMKMYKLLGEEKERFLLWAVCSIQLQVLLTSGGEKLLPLAEALLKKHIDTHSLHEPEGVIVYIRILEQQKKYDAALDVLLGKLGCLIGKEEDKLRMQGKLLAQVNNYFRAAEIYESVLELCPDDWESFLHYLGCLLEQTISWSQSTEEQSCSSCLADQQDAFTTPLSEEVFNARISTARKFVEKLQNKTVDQFTRGPYLANIEIERCCRMHESRDDGRFLRTLLTYFDKFGHLSCWASDVEKYLHMLTENEKSELLDYFNRVLQDLSDSALKSMGVAVTLYKVQEIFGGIFTKLPIELEGIVTEMFVMFCTNLVLSKDLDSQENMHGEELLCIVSSVLVQLFWRTRNLGYLLEAILVLEFGLVIRRHVWQYKILLLHLYSYLGALPLAYEWYGTLDVKNILLETVSHHILPQMLNSPCLHEASDILQYYLKFMDDHLRESADLTCLAYHHRTYTKVPEFVQFKERLQNSMSYLSAKCDSVIVRLKEKALTAEEAEAILENVNFGMKFLAYLEEDKLKILTFNHDFEARPWWTPTSSVNLLAESFEEASLSIKSRLCKCQSKAKEGAQMKDIQRKLLVPRLVYLSLEAASSPLKVNVETNGSYSTGSGIRELKILLEKYAVNIGFSSCDPEGIIAGISECIKSKKFSLDAVSWISLAVFANAYLWSADHTAPSQDEHGPGSWDALDSLFQLFIKEHLKQRELLLTSPGNSSFTALVQLVTEPISWHILFIQSCLRGARPVGKKKKKGHAAERPNLPQGQVMLLRSVQCLRKAISDIQAWLSEQMEIQEDQYLDSLLSPMKENAAGRPGWIFHALNKFTASPNPDLGARISQSLESWSSTAVMRKIICSHRKMLGQFSQICDVKLEQLDLIKRLTESGK